MHPWYVPIEAEILRRQYVDERLTMADIAARTGCTEVTIRRRLRQFGIRARRPGPPVKREAPDHWTAALAYVVGLMATDGNLSSDGRHLAIGSNDVALLESVKRCFGLTNSITRAGNGRATPHYRLQWGDRSLYEWFQTIGLTPAKSLTLGALAIPESHFVDFFRGCIDGDGSVITYTDRYHAVKNPLYVYDRLYVSLVSASLPFITWIRTTAHAITGAKGDIAVGHPRCANHHPLWRLRYAKRESILILRWMYYAHDVPCLDRKRATAERFLSRLVREYPDRGGVAKLGETRRTQNSVPVRA